MATSRRFIAKNGLDNGGLSITNAGTPGSSLEVSGAFGVTLGATGTTNVTLPTSGTLATVAQLPTVNNGTLTLAVSGTGLSGLASFTANQSGSSTFTVTSNATSANTVSTIVARDASGNFSAGTITASLTGAASLNVLKAGDTMTGALTMTLATGKPLIFSAAAGTARRLAVQTSGLDRWQIGGEGTLETGSNAGTNFIIQRYDDAGSLIDISFTINRATGLVSLTNGLTVTGTATATTFSGSGASLTNIPNGALTNSSVTIGSTNIALGGTSTTLAGLTSVTSTSFVGALTGNASTATTATELAGGVAGNVPYQAGAGNTSFVTNAAGVLQAATSGATPAWTTTPTLTGTNFTGIPNAALTNSSVTVGSTNIALGDTSTTLAGLTSVTSTSFVGALTGNASTATTLATGRTIGMTGDVTWTSASFNGSANVTGTSTLATVNASPQTDTFRKITVNGKGLTTATSAVLPADITTALGYTPVNDAGDTMTGPLILSADPTAALGAATKQYVDNVASGLNAHAACETATTATLASSTGGTITYNNGSGGVGATLTTTTSWGTIGGLAVSLTDRVLVKNEASQINNGVYVVTSTTVLTRATDFDDSPDGEVVAGDFVYIQQGTLGGTQWVQTTVNPIIGTNNIVFTQLSGSGTVTGGTGITVTGNSVALATGNTLSLFNLATNGLVARTAANTVTARSIAVSGSGLSITNADGVAGNPTITSNATNANTASTIVLRDGSGNFSAGTITATLSGNATTATDITGGSAGQVLYQVAANDTGYVTNAAGVLQALTSGATPTWTTTPTLAGTNFTSIPNGALTNSSVTIGSTNIALGGTSTTLAGLSSVTSTSFVGALTGNASTATTATELAGGVAGNVPYQAGAGNTSFVTNAAGVLQAATSGATPAWTTTPTLTGTNFTGIPNAALTNSSVTIGSTNIALGGTSTTLAGLTSVTSTSFVGALTGNATTATSVSNSVTFNNGGAGAASGTTYNGSAAQTISYNTIGAAPSANPVFTGQADFADGTAALPSITFSSDTDTGIYRVSPNVIGVATAGLQGMTIDANQNTRFFGTIGVNDFVTTTSSAIGSSITLDAEGIRYGINNGVVIDNTTPITVARSGYGSANTITVDYQNATAFNYVARASYNLARTGTAGGNLDTFGELAGSYNHALNQSSDVTYFNVENMYGAFNYAQLSGTTSNSGSIRGSYNLVNASGAGSLGTNAYGVQTRVQTGASATITNGYLFYGDYSVSGTISNRYGLYIPSVAYNYVQGGFQVGGTAQTAGTTGIPGLGVGVAPSGTAGTITTSSTISAGTQFLAPAGDTISAPGYSWATDPNLGLFRPAADTLGFTTNGGERMRIDSSGNVQIGTTASSSSSALTVRNTPGVPGIVIDNATGVERLHMYARQTAGVSRVESQNSNLELSTWDPNDMVFKTDDTERMRISSTGTITFGYPITSTSTVSAAGGFKGPLTDTNNYRIFNPTDAFYSNASSSNTGAIKIQFPVGMVGPMMGMTIKCYEYTTNESFEIHCGGYMYNVGNTWANNPYAYIIGNPSIDRRFNVRFGYTAGGKAVIYIGELASSWSYLNFGVTEVRLGYSGASSSFNTGWVLGFEATAFENVTATISNSQVGYATSTNVANATVLRDGSGNFTAGTITATVFNATSTAKVKDAIVDLGKPYLEKFSMLKPREYDRTDYSAHEFGFIAEEMAEVYPEIVSKTEDGAATGIDYGRLSAILTAKVQEQQSVIDKLQDQMSKVMELLKGSI